MRENIAWSVFTFILICNENKFREWHQSNINGNKSPGTWQLQPPKPSLQWHWWSKHTPFEHVDPSSLSQSSVKNLTFLNGWSHTIRFAFTYLNIWALFSVRLSPCNNLAGHHKVWIARRFEGTPRTRWPDIRSIRLPGSEKTLRVCCQKGFSDWKIVKVPENQDSKLFNRGVVLLNDVQWTGANKILFSKFDES